MRTGWILTVWFAVWSVCAAGSATTAPAVSEQAVCVEHLPSIRYAFHFMDEPRPIRIHVLTIDLSEGRVEPIVVIAKDSPEEDCNAIRTDPRRLARHPLLLAFINTNPWSPWAPTYPTHVTISGLAASGGVIRSRHQGVSIWTDKQGRVFLGTPDEDADIQEGVGGFQQILKETEVMVAQGGAIHPRTAIGINEKGDKLYLVVADGRQTGFSEGMTLGELALFMRELGCRDAANMDGGGSSVMGVVDEDGDIKILNNPPAPPGYLRPLPIILTIRQKPAEDTRQTSAAADPNHPSGSHN